VLDAQPAHTLFTDAADPPSPPLLLKLETTAHQAAGLGKSTQRAPAPNHVSGAAAALLTRCVRTPQPHATQTKQENDVLPPCLARAPAPPSLPSSSSSSLSSLAPCPSSSPLLRPPGSSHRVLRVSTFGCHVSPPVRSCEYRQAAAAVYLSLQDTQDASLDTFKAFAPVVVQGQGGELDSLGKNLSQRRDFAPARSDTDLPRQALGSM
jgi:hypothetical protein